MIAVDVMGGDYAPQEAVLGALAAAEKGVPLILFGNQDKVIPLLVQHNRRWRSLSIEVVHCSDVIDMDDEPIRGMLRKRNSSIVEALQAIVSGKARAFVSAGNSGAVVAAASIVIGRAPGVIRPAIGGFLPSVNGSFLCLDLGANPDCRPEHLLQFGYMGHAYTRIAKQIARPKIALLSNGHESYKGSALVKETFNLFQNADFDFIGNIESNDIFSGVADVVVTDGFTGNILLKGMQGTSRAIFGWVRDFAEQSLWSRLICHFARPIFSHLKNKIEYSRTGGALLFGVKAPVVVAHGSSKRDAIEAAIFVANSAVENDIIPLFNKTLEPLLERRVIQNVHDVSFEQQQKQL